MSNPKTFIIDNVVLMKEWNYEKNNELGINPEKTGGCINKKVWWLCHEGHPSYEARISDRVLHNSGCPYCSGRLPVVGKNDLQTWCEKNDREDLLLDWDYLKNSLSPKDVTYASNKKVNWVCHRCHNQFEKQIDQRTLRFFGCPKCKVSGTSFPEQFIYLCVLDVIHSAENRSKQYGWEIDIFIKELKIGIEYNGAYYHNKPSQIKNDNEKRECLKKQGIQIISVYEENSISPIGFNDIVWKYSRQMENLEKLCVLLFQKINYLCGTDYEVQSSAIERIYAEARKNTYGIKPEKSLGYLYPEIAVEWMTEKNEGIDTFHIMAGTHDKYYWKCKKCGNVWLSKVSDRVHGHGCMLCGRKKQVESWMNNRMNKYNFLQWCEDNNRTDLLEDWDIQKNATLERTMPSQYSYGSNECVYWKNTLTGHTWRASISNRKTSMPGCYCKECSYARRGKSNREAAIKKKGINLVEWCNQNGREDILEDWDYEKNVNSPDAYTKGSNSEVFWICQRCGHRWKSRIKVRTKTIKSNKCYHKK